MNLLEEVFIKGFWGNHDVNIRLGDSLNFIIGPNGSGKSTALKLVAGVLLADKNYLSKTEFSHIRLTLKDPKSRKKPYIEVTRDQDSPFFHCEYKIHESASEKPFVYKLSELDGYESATRNSYFLRVHLAGKESAGKTLISHLGELTSLTWLSVQRMTTFEEKSGDPLDIRLEDFSNRLVRHLSALSRKVNQLYEVFQEQVFLSLLLRDDERIPAIPTSEQLKNEHLALDHIFSEFHMDRKSYTKKTQAHFSMLDRIRRKMEGKEELSNGEIMAIVSLNRIESTVEMWGEIIEQKKQILSSKNRFLDLLNNLMQRKIVDINDRNEITIKTDSGKKLKPHELSSGEKQILIILGEALLQEGKQYIYMADEPEISLHVAWQETLARNIKSLNPAAQIIFATHSPDIVGPDQNKIIDMERCIK